MTRWEVGGGEVRSGKWEVMQWRSEAAGLFAGRWEDPSGTGRAHGV